MCRLSHQDDSLMISDHRYVLIIFVMCPCVHISSYGAKGVELS